VVEGPDEPHQDGTERDDSDDNQEVSHLVIVDLGVFTGSEPTPRGLKKSLLPGDPVFTASCTERP
jgi:hypothetical protein